MARSLSKSKGRREKGPFLALPRAVVDSPQYARLSAYGVKLLIDLYAQYRGNNNGDLSAAYKLMQPRGWRSKGTLHKALQELRQAGWVVVSRQGGRHRCSLYALTYLAIDECKGRDLDISPTAAPLGTWKQPAHGNSCTRYADQCTRYADQSEADAA